jgi:hypothetical protein
MWVGLIRSSEGWDRRKRQRKSESTLSPGDGTLTPLVLRPSDSDRIVAQALLGYSILFLMIAYYRTSQPWVNFHNKSLIIYKYPIGFVSMGISNKYTKVSGVFLFLFCLFKIYFKNTQSYNVMDGSTLMDFFFSFVVLVFEFRVLCLLGECSITWAMPPALFCFHLFFT